MHLKSKVMLSSCTFFTLLLAGTIINEKMGVKEIESRPIMIQQQSEFLPREYVKIRRGFLDTEEKETANENR